MKNFINRAAALMFGGMIGVLAYTSLLTATIPLTILLIRMKTSSWLIAGPLGFFLGAAVLPIIAIGGLPLFAVSAWYFYRTEKHNQENEFIINNTNKKLMDFLKNAPRNLPSIELTQEQIFQFESIIANTTNSEEKREYQRLLDTIRGDSAQTPIELNDYYTLKEPITIKQTISKVGCADVEHYQMYERAEFQHHVRNCSEIGKVVFNPIITNHHFKMDDQNKCVCLSDDNTTYTYEFSHGFTNTVLNACRRIQEVIERWKTHAPLTQFSTTLINQKLPPQRQSGLSNQVVNSSHYSQDFKKDETHPSSSVELLFSDSDSHTPRMDHNPCIQGPTKR